MKKPVSPRRLALIGRDGTIVVDKVYLNDLDGIEFAPEAIEGLRRPCAAGFALVLIRESRAGFSTLRRSRGFMTS